MKSYIESVLELSKIWTSPYTEEELKGIANQCELCAEKYSVDENELFRFVLFHKLPYRHISHVINIMVGRAIMNCTSWDTEFPAVLKLFKVRSNEAN